MIDKSPILNRLMYANNELLEIFDKVIYTDNLTEAEICQNIIDTVIY